MKRKGTVEHMICGGVWNEMEDMFEVGREKSQTVSSFHELRNIFGGFSMALTVSVCVCEGWSLFTKYTLTLSFHIPENHLDFILSVIYGLGSFSYD